MTETTRTSIEIPWRTIFKLIAAAALIWIWLRLVAPERSWPTAAFSL